jgi:hypothetical protein
VCGVAFGIQCGRMRVEEVRPAVESPVPLTLTDDVTDGGTRIDVASPDPAPNLKAALMRLWCGCCGTECDSPEVEYCCRVVQAASREQLLTVYTELVSSRSSVSCWEVGRVASCAAKLPVWPALRDALRHRRDYLPDDDRLLFEVFEFFTAHGEWCDLDWFWKMAGSEDNIRRLVAYATIKRLQARLNALGQ